MTVKFQNRAQELLMKYQKENPNKLFYGIFKFSPNNKNVTVFKETDRFFKDVLNSTYQRHLNSIKRYEDRIISNPDDVDVYQEFIDERKREIRNLFVKPENNVFYIADVNFNIIFETKKIYKKGNFTDIVKKALIKFGIEYNSEDFSKNYRTDSSLEELIENVSLRLLDSELIAFYNKAKK